MGRILGFYALPHPPIVIPEIGRGEEDAIRNTSEAFDRVSLEIAGLKPDTIIIVTPHGPLFQDAIALTSEKEIRGNLGRFGASKVAFHYNINSSLTDRICDLAEEAGVPCVQITHKSAKAYGAACELDHGTMVPLYFINKRYADYRLVHITYGLLNKVQLYRFGMCIQKAVEDSTDNVVFIASGDLSHRLKKDGPYEYSPYGAVFDRDIKALLEMGDTAGVFSMDPRIIKEAGECALNSYYILLGVMNGYEWKGKTYSYEGVFGVGYLIMSFEVNDEIEKNEDILAKIIEQEVGKFKNEKYNEDPYVNLAKESLIYYITHGKYMPVPSYATEEMTNTRSGVFVSIKKNGELRGCIGTIKPTTGSIAQEIIRNAVEAGMYDPRFSPVRIEEWNDLDFSVDVLTHPQPAVREELDPKKYGVIVRSGYKSGLLLPDLEGVDTVEDQLKIALRKAGISPWEPYTIEKFQVIRHKGEQP
ncbi:MAG TPA: AmmeMemoRadiSam system protein A [Clostridiales bacterium]|nr:AmmeMemoRadiSam system protein A [Clostridiales bacterium]